MADAESGSSVRRTKIERVVDRYDLEGLQLELAARWTAPADDRASLRELARDVNVRILEAELAAADIDVLDGEIENYYRLLTDDEVSAGRRTEARSRLERAGVDIESLELDFVSHQAVHTYLTDRAGVSFEGVSRADRIDSARQAIEQLEGRIESVAETNLDQLTASGDLDVGEISVIHSLDVVCSSCGERYAFGELLEAGSCGCSKDVN